MHCRPDAFAHAFPDARCQPSIVVSPSRLDLRVARRLASFPAWRRFFWRARNALAGDESDTGDATDVGTQSARVTARWRCPKCPLATMHTLRSQLTYITFVTSITCITSLIMCASTSRTHPCCTDCA